MEKVSDRVIAILNQDPAARKLLDAYKKAAARAGYSEQSKEYQEGRDSIVAIAISGNEQAVQVFADAIYARHNASK